VHRPDTCRLDADHHAQVRASHRPVKVKSARANSGGCRVRQRQNCKRRTNEPRITGRYEATSGPREALRKTPA
jgi:hypothetical protein